MTVFRQLGDPLAGAVCLCQHHGAAIETLNPISWASTYSVYYENIPNATAILSVQIITTERCCIVVNAATNVRPTTPISGIEIERPLGTIRTQQEAGAPFNALDLLHHASWEVLDPGTYTYYLVNRTGATAAIYAAWIKAIASDCEG